ncbi:uncharacterized protein N7482_008075 [Penicillium canariense]|uniref:Cystinosin n=1 Tax=Penicillium canariense TaxID=189055 RepID=A0A9W9HVK7_9EURO|nr:uncharacterized protein N7482_008075 [Penicillium canariense]KAJ5156975.1 hypothetical protein N7482_008075 [Penicillium canariense]
MDRSQLEVFVRALSRMASWSLSFFPQPLSMWRRKSTSGVSIDFGFINLLGFICYTIYTSTFLYSPMIRYQYAARHPAANEPTVRLNDLAFAAGGVLMCLLMYLMFWPSLSGLHVPRRQRVSWTMRGFSCGCVVAPLVVICIVLGRSPDGGNNPFTWAWIDVIYAFSYDKLAITTIKYIPQAWLNYQRQSTVGWNIWTIILDLIGGVLSLVQLVLDSSLQSDWSGITGNPAKLLLSNITIFFDLVFIVQHYILYRDAADPKAQPGPDSTTPLLDDSYGRV